MAIDVFGLGNTLVDIQTFVDDKLLKKLKITKGIMTLIDEKQSMEVLAAIANLKAKSLPGGSCGNSISMASLMGAKTVYNHADFRLMSKRAVEQFSQYKESNLYLRGLMPLIGYQTDMVYYDRKERVAGESKYPLKKMLAFAFEGITSFSTTPIRW